MPDITSDLDLVSRFLDGDDTAARTVVELIDKALTHWSRRFGSEIDDIRSDVNYKLLLSLREGAFEFKSSLKTYINRLANHTCIDYWRYQKRVKLTDINNMDLAAKELDPEQQMEKSQFARLLFRVLRTLPRECIQLWRMNLQEGLTCDQIGSKLGQTGAYIRRKLWLCREKAKDFRDKILHSDKQL